MSLENKRNCFTLVLTSLMLSFQVAAQTFTPDLRATGKWKLYNRSAEHVKETGKTGVRLNELPNDGTMVLEKYDFSNGTIELDIKGKNVAQQSFVGIAFHLKDSNRYEAIYFRPFNFSNPDTMRRSRAVQYISMPEYDWETLRNTYPGKYESKVNPVPDPDGWFHVKITVSGKKVNVYVDNSKKPSLEVERLSSTSDGSIALWVGNGSGGSFANLKITPEK